MDIVKKNIISIIAGVFALVALIAIYIYPLDGYFTTLKADTTKRAALYNQIQGLASKRRTLPTFELGSLESAPQLPGFPTKPVIELGRGALTRMKAESDGIYKQAVELNRRGRLPLVVDKTLPAPLSGAAALAVRPGMEKALTKLREETLKAGIPPTEEQVKARRAALWKVHEKDIIKVDGKPMNEAKVVENFEREAVKLKEVMQKEMSEKYKMYVDPTKVMTVPVYLPLRDVPDPKVIWWAQVEYWVTHDVCDAIAMINGDAKNVLQAPVKNLLVLTIPDHFFPGTTGLSTGGSRFGAARGGGEPEEGGAAAAGPPDPTATIPSSGAQSPTKRISNNLYDVCRFSFSVEMEAQHVARFIRHLTANRFLTVLRFDMTSVDSLTRQHEGYVYGPRPVVRLDLECELLFLRQWTIPLMPREVKRQIGLEAPAGGGGRVNEE